MSFSALRNIARDLLRLVPAVSRLHRRAAELGQQARPCNGRSILFNGMSIPCSQDCSMRSRATR